MRMVGVAYEYAQAQRAIIGRKPDIALRVNQRKDVSWQQGIVVPCVMVVQAVFIGNWFSAAQRKAVLHQELVNLRRQQMEPRIEWA